MSNDTTGPGTLDVLNTGLGHLTLSFNNADPIERERAARAVSDLLRAGATLFVEVDGVLERVIGFDQARAVYIVADYPARTDLDLEAATSPAHVSDHTDTVAATSPRDEPPAKRGKRGKREIPAKSVRAHAVGRTGGG